MPYAYRQPSQRDTNHHHESAPGQKPVDNKPTGSADMDTVRRGERRKQAWSVHDDDDDDDDDGDDDDNRDGCCVEKREGGWIGWAKYGGSQPGGVISLPQTRKQSTTKRARTTSATDHVTVGTSGPMVMPGKYDFKLELAEYDAYVDSTRAGVADAGCVCGEGVTTSESIVSPSGGGEEAAVRTEADGYHYGGFQLPFVSKRRAFGIIEASERFLRVSLVGSDGGVLYSFDRIR